MYRNVGVIDRIVRIVLGVAAGVAIATGEVTGTVAVITGIGATILLGTGIAGFCAIYAIFGVKTCPAQKKGE